MPERNAWTPFFWCVRMGKKQGARIPKATKQFACYDTPSYTFSPLLLYPA